MGKHYIKVENFKRQALVNLITVSKLSIALAARKLDIYYPTAKLIYKTFKKENRVEKVNHHKSATKKLIENDQEVASCALKDDTRCIVICNEDASRPRIIAETDSKRITCSMRDLPRRQRPGMRPNKIKKNQKPILGSS